MKRLGSMAIFTGSFLAFFVQPMIGRTMLPVFGGGAAVWISCLVAFQVLLMAGYGYAFVPARGRRALHVGLVVLAAILTAGIPWWKGTLFALLGSLPPAFGVIASVLALTGLTSLVLSANSTVVQSWIGGGREVYRLYSISNIGSFAGLLAYPLLVEPFVPLRLQWLGFGLLMLGYAAMLAGLSGKTRRDAASAEKACDADGTAPARLEGEPPPETLPRSPWLWVALPALSCALMTALTTHLTTDFAPLPLLWAVLLALFLVSYVIGFSRLGEKLLPVWIGLAVPLLAFAAVAMFLGGDNTMSLAYNAGAGVGLLLIVCTALHSWLCRTRPDAARLPQFYLATAFGGMVGGVLAGVVAPLVFSWISEYPLVLILTSGAFAWLLQSWRRDDLIPLNRLGQGVLALAVIASLVALKSGDGKGGRLLSRERGFYGVVSVRNDEITFADGHRIDQHVFYHGQTAHGQQLPDEEHRRKPTLYYSLNGGGIAFESYAPRKAGKPIRAGFVGMGAGTLAAFGREGDCFRFYEISPEAIRAATNTNLFTFLSDSAAKIEIIEGDARPMMERDRAAGMEKFDLLFIDAYSGDSIPTHLITREAFELYRDLTKEDGILAFHISNWHVDLWPVMKAAARELGMVALGSLSGDVPNEFATGSSWAFLSRGGFEPRMPTCCRRILWDGIADRPLMTDDFGSLIFNLRFNYAPPVEGDEY